MARGRCVHARRENDEQIQEQLSDACRVITPQVPKVICQMRGPVCYRDDELAQGEQSAQPSGDFAHREVREHLLVQVTCLRCLAIVGTGSTPAALQILEKAHKCKTAQ